MNTLHSYEAISDQLVSPTESSIFFSNKFPLSRKVEVLWVTRFVEGQWPCNYLGVPLHVGRLTIRLFDPLIIKVQKRLAGWKSKILSFGEKIILIKHVLSSMPIHILSVLILESSKECV